MKAANRDTTSLKDSIWWDVIKLALVPVTLAIFGALLNQRITQRDRMQNYLSSTTEIATKTDSSGKSIEIKNSPALRSLIRARTLLILSELDGKDKRQVMEFLANSDIHYQISLANADLRNADLSGIYLKHVNLGNADLRGAKLDRAILLGANLLGIKTDSNTSLKNLVIDGCTVLPKNNLVLSVKKASEPCRFNQAVNPVALGQGK
jgi:hypothetical protein